MARFLTSVILAASLAAVPAAGGAAATDAPAQSAFVAAYGHAAPVTRTVVRPAKPPGCECSGTATRVSLAVAPQTLIALADGRYALVSLETDPMGAHASPGAIAIAYLRRTADGWRLERRWDELVWTGDDGNPADHTSTLTRGAAPPLLFAIHSALHQGQFTDTAWAFALDKAGPRLVGSFPIGGRLDGDGCDLDTCGAWSYSGAIRPAWSSASLFTVTYKGWREWPGAPRKARFDASTGYHLVAGKLLPSLWVPLPDCGGDCVNGPGYPPR